jgi:anti-sigma factor RsiW
MNHEAQLKLQAYLDGELPAAESAEVQDCVARDADARSLLAELTNTSAALEGHEANITLPESREFYWSKIQREIERAESQAPPTVRPVIGISWVSWLRRQFAPVAGVASLAMVLGLLLLRPSTGPVSDSGVIELASDDMGSHTFRDQDQHITVVWLDDRTQDSEFTPADPLASVQPE